MTLLFTLLPLYLLGNFHCLSMCGPIAFFLSRSPFKHFYLLGRLSSFTLAGGVAAVFGTIANLTLSDLGIPGLFSFLTGVFMLGIAFIPFLSHSLVKPLDKILKPLQQKTTKLALQEKPAPLFWFGFSSVLLPCGQSLVVFAACSLTQNVTVGLLNGFVFSCLTTPSLFLAMNAHNFLKNRWKGGKNLFAYASLPIGLIAMFRGFAEWGWIEHRGFSLGDWIHLSLW